MTQALARKHVVLCVDDDPSTLAALRRLFRGEPYEVVTARDPREALALLEKAAVDLVISDQRMPGLCGTAFLDEVRRRSPRTTRVMLTGYPDSSSVEGIHWLISKPWNDDALRLTLRQLMDERGRPPPEPEPAAPRGVEAIRAEIRARLGSVPPLFDVAGDQPEAWDALWQQTRSCYLDNPLPALFKEKLFAYLSRYSPVLYGVVRHACALRPLGLSGPDVLRLLEDSPPPTETVAQLSALVAAPGPLKEWPEAGTDLEKDLFRGAVASFLNGPGAGRVRAELRRLLGARFYPQLLLFLSYVRACHAWTEGHLELSPDDDPLVRRHLPELLAEEPRLDDFFKTHAERVRRERRRTEDRLLDLISGLRKREVAHQREQDHLETRIFHRTAELSQVNAELLKEVLERKEAEEELREMNLMLENAVEGISRLDSHGRYLSVNKAYAEMSGRPPEELPGKPWLEAVHPDDRALAGAAVERMKAAGKAELEARALRRDGSAFHFHAVLIAALDKQGNFIGHYGFVKDISERKAAEGERDRLTARLFQGQKLQAIGQLSAGIAHEINNPVGYILSNLNTLREYWRDLSRLLDAAHDVPAVERIRRELDADFLMKDFEKAVEESRQGAERIRDIVKGLKEFTHADEGELREGDLNASLENAIRLCWNELKYKAAVHRDLAEVPRLPIYRQRLEQVFVNILVNAAQAIAERGEIFVRTRVEGEWAFVRVRDTGCGIAPEHVKKVFDPFFTTKPVGKGTGLGLYLAYKAIRAHGGEISVGSEVGKGTEFTIRLPLRGRRQEVP